MIYGYGRVSTKGQATGGKSLESQEKLLKEHGAEIIYMDAFTETKIDRPEFNKLLKILKAGDTLVVAKLDRFARSVSQASDFITELIDKGVRVDVCNLGILDNSSMSTLMRNILWKRIKRTEDLKKLEREAKLFLINEYEMVDFPIDYTDDAAFEKSMDIIFDALSKMIDEFSCRISNEWKHIEELNT